MGAATIELGEELAALLGRLGPVDRSAREAIVLELYRRGIISGGKAGELLGMPKLEFIQYASGLGIAHFRLTADDLKAELTESERI